MDVVFVCATRMDVLPCVWRFGDVRPRPQVAYPFQAYQATDAAAFRADVAETLDTALNFII